MRSDGKAEVITFGGLAAKNAEGQALIFRTRKTASLFAYLAANLGKEVYREALCSIFWPESEESFARNSLSVALTSLRKQLQSGLGEGGDVLTGDYRTVRLSYDFVWCDVVEFHRQLKKSTLLETQDERIQAILGALELVEGPFLANDDEPWARLERYRCEQDYVRALCNVLDHATNPDDMERALRVASRALSWDPKQKDVVQRVDRLRASLGLKESAQYRYRQAAKPVEVSRDSLAERVDDVPASAGEHLGGAVPLSSKFYVERQADNVLLDAISASESLVLVKGPRQIGKSSLLARGVAKAREAGATVLLTDFQSIDSEYLQSTQALYQWLIMMLQDQLGGTQAVEFNWDIQRAPAMNLERFLRERVLAEHSRVFWALDEVDRVFSCPSYSDFFALLRSWHNRRAMEPDGAWHGLTIALTYSTEIHVFIDDLNQSPFNVGIPLELKDFDIENVRDLNDRYGKPLASQDELRQFQGLTGGHPFLVRRGLHEMFNDGVKFNAFESTAADDNGPYCDHLRRIRAVLDSDRNLMQEMRRVLSGLTITSAQAFYRLRSAGLVRGTSGANARIRCELYKRFFEQIDSVEE